MPIYMLEAMKFISHENVITFSNSDFEILKIQKHLLIANMFRFQ